MRALYIDPDSGLMTTEYRRGMLELRGYSPGVTCPAIVRCAVHGRHEPFETVTMPDHRQGGTAGYLALAKVAAVACARSRTAYINAARTISAAIKPGGGVFDPLSSSAGNNSPSGYLAVTIADAPVRAVRRYCEAVSSATGTSWDQLVLELSRLPVPQEQKPRIPGPSARPFLHPDGLIIWSWTSAPTRGTLLPLEREQSWLARPDESGRWELYDSFAAPKPAAMLPLVRDLLTVAIATSSTSCDQAAHLVSIPRR